MAKLSYHLPPGALLTLYHSLIHVHLTYAPQIRPTTFPTYLIKLKGLQNKALRNTRKTFSKDRIFQHYCRLQILKLDYLYKFEVAKQMHQFTHKKLPAIFCQYFINSNNIFKYSTRNSIDYSLYLRQFSANRTQHSILYVDAKMWNNIPSRFKQFSYLNLNFFYKQAF